MRIALTLGLCVALASCATLTPKRPPPNSVLVFFPPNSAVLLPNAARVLNGVAADANRQGAVVEVSGPVGKHPPRPKPSLEEQRAVAVEHALVAAGVAEERIRRVKGGPPPKKKDPAGTPVEIHLVPKPVA
jgi:hypothetical protein